MPADDPAQTMAVKDAAASATATIGTGRPQFQLVTRKDCHLCDVMKAQLETLAQRLDGGFDWSPVDVDSDPVLVLYYGHLVPVVLHDGVRLAELRCSDEELAARLRPHVPATPSASVSHSIR